VILVFHTVLKSCIVSRLPETGVRGLIPQIMAKSECDCLQSALWRRIRRPFRYPMCTGACKWEVYDVNQAGCLVCGKHHHCRTNAVDSVCPLVQCDDQTRVCQITGYILPEVRHATDEFRDTASYVRGDSCTDAAASAFEEMDSEVQSVVTFLLMSQRASRCRQQENAKQYHRLTQHMHKQMRVFKMNHPGKLPNVCHILAQAMAQEKYWRFIEEASESLIQHCSRNISLCLLELKSKGAKVNTRSRLQDLVCGMLYMLKHGLIFHNRILLSAIPEVDRCLPHENKIEQYFGISSKVICMTENEVKLIFRESYQT
jgi:hypothetical protein